MRLPVLLRLPALVLFIAFAATRADAGTVKISVALDTDSNAATGCALATAGGTVQGIEQIATTVITTNAGGAVVTRLERQLCTAGSFGAPVVYDATGWNVGLGNGSGGSAVVETSIPLSMLPPGAAMRALVTSDNGAGGQDATAAFALALAPVAAPAPIVAIPLSPWLVPPLALLLFGAVLWLRRRYPGETRLALLVAALAVSGIAWAATVLRDGNIADWTGVPPAVTDASGDAPAGADIVAVFFQQDASTLYLRVDADIRPDAAAVNTAPTVNAGANQAITLPATATLTGTASDDGLPNPPGALTTSWSLVSGPGGVTFGNSAALNTTATFNAAGIYVLRLTASDSALQATSNVQVTVSDGAPLLLAIADRTIELGSRFQQLLVATDANGSDTLTYSLPTAPIGAALSPAPLVDWTPTAAQLGSNTFTARVIDGAGHAATTTFHVTVVHTNHPPQLAPQPNVILPVGTAFARTLQAADPDAGDVLAFALGAHPAGMLLTGAALNWPTAGKAPGDYAVTVRVTDPAGLFDEKSFTVTLTQAAPPPVANDDRYEARLGQTLTVPAAGVLGNDLSLRGSPLTAVRLTDPDKGTLDTLRADGGFTYTAPASLPPAPGLNPVVSWRGVLEGNNYFALAADFDHDGVVDYATSTFGDFRAWRGSDGAQLWQFDKSITTHADISGCSTYIDSGQFALGDVAGGGDIYLFASINCDYLSIGGQEDRFFAANASQILPGGKVAAQWVSPRLSRPHPGAYATNASPTLPDPPVTPTLAASAARSVPALAKLTAGGSTKLLTRFLADSNYGYYYDTPNSGHLAYAACRTMTGLPADEGRACKATFVIDAATGAINQVLTAPNPANENAAPRNSPTDQNIPIIADLDGDGQVEIISGGDIWQLAGGVWVLAWQAQFDSTTAGVKKSFEPSSVAVADLDGDGKAEVVFHLLANGVQTGGIYIFDRQGALLRKIPLATNVSGLLSVADVDGDGAPEILIAGDSFLYAYRPDGTLLWAKRLPDILTGVVPALSPGGTEPMTSAGQLYVYDLDLDGVPEVIVQGTRRLFILSGRTGAELWSVDTENDGFFQPGNPLLVDADGDGHVDIIVHLSERWNCGFFGSGPGGCKGNAMRISGGSNNWAPGPKVQNQLNFRPAAADAGAKILYDGSMRRDFRQQAQLGTVIDPRIAQSTSFTYKANDGAADSPPATVFIDIKPPNRPPVITSTPPTGLLSVTPYARRVYTITATDPDPGDTVHYEFVSSTFDTTYYPAPTVDSVTGGVDIYSGPCGSFGGACDFGRVLVIVAAVDSHGARTEQSFFVDITYVSAAVPNVIGQLLPAARTAVEAASLTPLVGAELFASQPAGTVIGQDPAAGTANVPRSAAVKLTVSKGPQPVVMPFVVGQQLAPVNALLTAAGLNVNAATVFSTTIPVGEIMAQSPVAGTELLPATAPPVALTVSAGGPLPAPIASIVLEPGPGPQLRLAGEELQYKAVAILTDGTSADVTLTAAWSSSVTAKATINAVGVAKAIASGTTTITATLAGKSGQGTLNVAALVLGDNAPPIALITAPVDGSAVTGPTTIVGTASDTNFLRYELAIAGAGSEDWRLIGEGSAGVTNGALGTLDPTLLLNGIYTLRLTVFDRGSNTAKAEIPVQVEGNQKVGYFTLSYTDLIVPLSGIPIQVTRTYDSRDTKKGDFGVGWSMGLKAVRVSTTRELGTGWQVDKAGLNYNLTAGSEHFVSVTLPSGRVESFDVRIAPILSPLVPFATATASFVARPGALGTLRALENVDLLIIGAQPGPVTLVDDVSLNTLHPDRFVYTQRDGTEFIVRRSKGVESVKDSNGNQITITPGGITHSAGTSIVFTRDAESRITSITDPKGMSRIYAYSGAGDLASTTDRLSNTTRYFYNRSHGLIRVIDPLGQSAARANYDAQGRLIALTDANGQMTRYQHDLPGRQELIEDPLGRITVYNYDTRGNILSRTDPLGNTSTFTYSAQDHVLTQTDPLGATTSLAYDAQDNVASVTDPLGRTNSFTYDPGGRLLTTTDARGYLTSLRYDAAGGLIGTTDALGHERSYENDSVGNPTLATDALGAITRQGYDSAGRRIQLTDALGAVLTFQHDDNGNLLSQQDPTAPTAAISFDAEGRITGTSRGGLQRSIAYDAAGQIRSATTSSNRQFSLSTDPVGRLTGIADPVDGPALLLAYDAVGNLKALGDGSGNQMTNVFDAADRLVATTGPDGSIEHRAYDAAGRLVEVTDVLGNTTRRGYDAAGQLVSVTDALGGQTTFQYDAGGNRIAQTDPAGRTTTFDYDAANRLTRTTFADGVSESRVYDAGGRLIRLTDPADHSTTYTYDVVGSLLSITDPLGQVTRHAYQGSAQRSETTDANGHTTRFAYDDAGRLTATTFPLGSVEITLYDITGNPLSKANGQGESTQYQYDAYGRRSATLLPGAQSETYTYTTDHLLRTVVDARGTTTLDYDAQTRRLVRLTEPDGRYVRYAYDAAGNRTLTAHRDGASELATQYAYDALNRLIRITDPGGGVSTQAWDSAGNLVTTSRPNGVTTSTTYDVRNRPIAIAHRAAGGALIAQETYTLDALGNRVRIDRQDGSRVEYRYDALSRVTRDLRFDHAGILTFEAAFAYDAVGNLVGSGPPASPAVYVYNADNQLVSGGGVTFSYDGAGRLVQENWTPPGGPPKSKRYIWDARDRMTGFRDANGAATTYGYDSGGARMGKGGAAGVTSFLVDRDNATGYAQLARRTTAAGTDTFVWGSQMLQAIEAGTPRYPLFDALGSTRLLTGTNGSVTDAFDYRAYGEVQSASGTSGLPHRFAGEETDPESGLSYLRARYYDPRTGRFLSRDSKAGDPSEPLSLNPYLYVAGNPVNRTDPSGNDFTLISLTFNQAIDNMNKARSAVNARKALIRTKDMLVTESRLFGGVMAIEAIVEDMGNHRRVDKWFGVNGMIMAAVSSVLPEVGSVVNESVHFVADAVMAVTALKMLNGSTVLIGVQGFGILASNSLAEAQEQWTLNSKYGNACKGSTDLAYAYPGTSPPVLELCTGFFFSPPLPQKGTLLRAGKSSQPGIMLHEFSHLAAGTQDDAYQCHPSTVLTKAKDLKPGAFLFNADSYRCWAEDSALGWGESSIKNLPGP